MALSLPLPTTVALPKCIVARNCKQVRYPQNDFAITGAYCYLDSILRQAASLQGPSGPAVCLFLNCVIIAKKIFMQQVCIEEFMDDGAVLKS